jgi:spore coat protein A
MRKQVKAILFCAVFVVSMLILTSPLIAAQSPQVPMAGSAVPQFVQPLPLLSVQPGGTMNTVFGNQPLTIRMCEFQATVLPPGTFAAGVQPLTWVWGYLVDPTGTSTCADLVNMYKNTTTGAIDTYLGPVIVNQRGGQSTDITWVNDLGDTSTSNALAYKYSTDMTAHWADPLHQQKDGVSNPCMMMGGIPLFGSYCAQNYDGPIAAAPHLHGGEQPAEIDGSPDSWWTSDGLHWGHKYYSFGYSSGAPIAGNYALYKYPNDQEAAPTWFHDHTLGATRLNVYMGLAGAYYIYDPGQNLPANLPPVSEVVPLVLQDRSFDTNGQLFMPADSAGGVLSAPNPEHPYWVPEFVGDTIVINGKAWPYLNVQPKRYRFLFLNGSNARTYEMFLTSTVNKAVGPPLWVIGTDGGYLDAPAKLDPALGQKLLMQPGERYEVIIDFSGYAGQNLIIKNTGRTPYPKGAAPQGTTLGMMMQFRVSATAVADASYDPASGTPLRSGNQVIQRLVNPAMGTLATGVTVAKTRALTLNEVLNPPSTAIDPVTGVLTNYPGGPFEILVNNTKWSGESTRTFNDFTPIMVNGTTTSYTEMPVEGDTEVWEIINTTADAHPIHTHLVQFQLLNRQNYNTNKYIKAYNAAFPAKAFTPAFGPPLNYNPSTASGNKYGGNPDVTPYLQGPANPPQPNEAGWKDTVITYPGQVTRFVVRWAPDSMPINTPAAQLHFPFDPSATDPGSGLAYQYNYVWHCHIIDHEDNEMMRPDVVQLNPAAPLPPLRSLVKGVDY